MLEKTFRANVVREFKRIGNSHAVPIESACTPGFPDVVLFHNTISLLELKVVNTMDSGRLLSSLFEKTQLVFFNRLWKSGVGIIYYMWCGIYDNRDDGYFFFRLMPGTLERPLHNILNCNIIYGISLSTVCRKLWTEV